MSKSRPETCIFIHDTQEEINKKMKTAFCPAKEVEGNPITDICKHIIFAKDNATITIQRPKKFGGDIDYNSYKDLEKDFIDGKLHPLDLKNAVAKVLGEILEPVHKYFEKRPEKLETMEKLLTETRKVR